MPRAQLEQLDQVDGRPKRIGDRHAADGRERHDYRAIALGYEQRGLRHRTVDEQREPADVVDVGRAGGADRDLAPSPDLTRQGCRQAIHQPRYLHEYAFQSDDNGTLQGLVAAGFGAALIPLLASAPGDDRVRLVRLLPELPRRVIAVVWHRDRHRSPASRAFVEVAQAVSAKVERDLVEP